jgi:hypothetical protein
MSKTQQPDPVIEPPCPDCVEARTASGAPDALCLHHAERHARAHTYRYHREHAFRQHDSNVVPTGINMSRR